MCKEFGEINDQTNLAFKNVGIMYMEDEQYEEALVIFKQFLQRFEEIMGSDYAHMQGEYITVEELIESCEEKFAEIEFAE